MQGQAVSVTRRPGCAFDDERAEDYARSRSAGCTIHVSAQAAGIEYRAAKRLETTQEVRARVRELRPVMAPTRSASWFLEEYAQIAEEARRAANQEPDGKKRAALYEAAKHALDGGSKVLLESEGLLSNFSQGGTLPQAPTDLRAELRRRLSSPAITVPGLETSRETEEAAS
jgi:hypothetical protein